MDRLAFFAFFNLGTQEIFAILFIFLPVILMFTALAQCITATFAEPNLKLIWVLVILLLPILGSVLWFLIGRSQATRQNP